MLTVTDVSTTCAVVIFRVKVSCITSVVILQSIIPSKEKVVSSSFLEKTPKAKRFAQLIGNKTSHFSNG